MELPELGTTFQSKYRLDRVLGEGGFARVFEAEDIGAQRVVALKILKPLDNGYARDTESRFHREVRVIANLRDPHTVTMFDFGRSEQGLLFMVFEYVPGLDLSELLEQRGPLGDEATIHILRQVLQSLREAHQAGLLHRDLKPANIRVYEYMGDPLRVSLLDFGIAKPLKPSAEASAITHTGSLVGTPQYMSPEQLLEQQLTPASDVYSLGLVAFEMLTGTTAIKGNSLSDQLHVLAGASGLCLPPDAPVSPGLRRIVDRMISREPGTRLQTAGQVLRSLEAFVRGEPTAEVSFDDPSGISRPISGSQPLRPPSREVSSDSMERVYHPSPPSTERSGPIARQTLPGSDPAEPRSLSTPLLLGAMVLVLSCVAVAAAVGVKAYQDDEPVQKREFHLPPSLAVVPDDPPSTPATPATPTVDDEPAHPLGCNAPGARFIGEGRLQVGGVLERRDVLVYVPTGYDPRTPQPLLVAFHDVVQSPSGALQRFELAKLADREHMIVVLPLSPGLEVWKGPDEVAQAYRDVTEIRAQLCIDETRIYGFGHGAGGRAAARMGCDFPGVAAIATTAFRTDPLEKACLPKKRVPYLHIAAMNDRGSLPGGGEGCNGSTSLSVDAYDEFYRDHHKCGARRETWKEGPKTPNGTCYTWTCDLAPYVSCQVKGGREWPGPKRVVDTLSETFVQSKCDGAPADFPYQETIWQFLQSATPKGSE